MRVKEYIRHVHGKIVHVHGYNRKEKRKRRR